MGCGCERRVRIGGRGMSFSFDICYLVSFGDLRDFLGRVIFVKFKRRVYGF